MSFPCNEAWSVQNLLLVLAGKMHGVYTIIAKDLFVRALRSRRIVTIWLNCACPNFLTYLLIVNVETLTVKQKGPNGVCHWCRPLTN